jgi:hypothetical protein
LSRCEECRSGSCLVQKVDYGGRLAGARTGLYIPGFRGGMEFDSPALRSFNNCIPPVNISPVTAISECHPWLVCVKCIIVVTGQHWRQSRPNKQVTAKVVATGGLRLLTQPGWAWPRGWR